jgi:hypothetical protein
MMAAITGHSGVLGSQMTDTPLEKGKTMAAVRPKAVAFRTLTLLYGQCIGGYALSLFLVFWAVQQKFLRLCSAHRAVRRPEVKKGLTHPHVEEGFAVILRLNNQ